MRTFYKVVGGLIGLLFIVMLIGSMGGSSEDIQGVPNNTSNITQNTTPDDYYGDDDALGVPVRYEPWPGGADDPLGQTWYTDEDGDGVGEPYQVIIYQTGDTKMDAATYWHELYHVQNMLNDNPYGGLVEENAAEDFSEQMVPGYDGFEYTSEDYPT